MAYNSQGSRNFQRDFATIYRKPEERDNVMSISSLLMFNVLIISAISQLSSYPSVLMRLGGSRFRPNPFNKISTMEVQESN